MKVGLVLEGGGMRGMFTAGVLDVMLENHIDVDGIIGVSAGAVFGCNYKSNQPGRAIRYNMQYCNDKRYGSFRTLLKTGNIYEEDFCYRELPEELDVFDRKAYQKSPIEFYVVATDLKTGLPVYQKCDCGDRIDMAWFRASSSMPLVSQPVHIGEDVFLDGSMADSIPLKQFEDMGYERNIVILTQPEKYQKKKNKLMWLIRWSLRKYPQAVQAMAMRQKVYNASTAYIAKRALEKEVLAIYPNETLDVNRVEHDPNRLKAVYEQGRRIGLQNIDSIKQFVEDSHKRMR